MGLMSTTRYGCSKPPVGVGIDFSHPLAKDLTLCSVFSERGGRIVKNSAGVGFDGTLTGSNMVYDVGSRGLNLEYSSADVNSFVSYGATKWNYERTESFSIELILYIPSVARFLACGNGQTGTTKGIFIDIGANGVVGTVGLSLRNLANTNELFGRTGVVFAAGEWHHLLFTYDGSSTISGIAIYVDGKPQTITTVANTLTSSIIFNTNWALGRSGAFASLGSPAGTMYNKFSIYNRKLTENEAWELYTCPFDMFRPMRSYYKPSEPAIVAANKQNIQMLMGM